MNKKTYQSSLKSSKLDVISVRKESIRNDQSKSNGESEMGR